MSRQYWSEGVQWAVADGTAVANTTTETAIFTAPKIPANYMADGRVLRLRAFGKLSTTGTPTIGFVLRWGVAVSGTLLAQTELITCTNNSANVNWSLEVYIQTRTNGSTGTLLAIGDVRLNLTSSTHSDHAFGVSGFDAPATATCALNADTDLTLSAVWSAASSSNTLTGMIMTLESLN